MIKLLFSLIFSLNLALGQYTNYPGTGGGAGPIAAPIVQWQPGTAYTANQIIYFNRDFYRVVTDYISTANFYTDYFVNNSFMYMSQEGWSTAILSGGVCTINPAGARSVLISAGTMNFSDYWTNSPLRTITAVPFPDQEIQMAPFNDSKIVIYLDPTGVAQATEDYTAKMETENASLCRVLVDNVGIAFLNEPFRWIPGNTDNKILDLSSAIGMITRGLTLAPVAPTLTFNRSAGAIHFAGVGPEDPKQPNQKDLPAMAPASWLYGTGTSISSVVINTFDTLNYDPNGAGVISPIPANRWGVTRQYILPGGASIFIYPQFVYNTMQEALDGMNYELYVENDELQYGQMKAFTVFMRASTNLADPAQARTTNCPQFGCGTGGTGGVAGTSSGDMIGPAVSTLNAVVRFAGTTGKTTKNSGVTIADTTDNMVIPGSLTINSNGANSSIFPTGRGTSGQVLQTNGSGNLSWTTPSVSGVGNASNGALAIILGNRYVIADGMAFPSAVHCSVYVRQGSNYQVITVNGLFQNCGGLGCASFSVIANMIVGTKLMTALSITASPAYNISFTAGITGTVSIGRTCVRIDTGTGSGTNIGGPSTGTVYGAVGL